MKKFLIFLLILCSLFFLSSCEDFLSRGTVHILSIGLDYEKTSDIGSLKTSENDFKELGLCLYKLYSQRGCDCSLEYMTDSFDCESSRYPNRDNILEKLDSLKLNKNDLFVFIYSGHGLNEEGRASLVTAGNDSHGYEEIYTDELFDFLENLPCYSLVILDTCHSGGFINTGCYDRVSVIAASSLEQQSFGAYFTLSSGVYEPHGYLSYFLLNSLGWVHSQSEKTAIITDDGTLEVYGYFGSVQSEKTVSELFEDFMDEWYSITQTPCINFSLFEVVI